MANIQLTFTQCKQLKDNGVDIREFLDNINNQPDFIKFMSEIETIADFQAILQGGCKSGAYMPAVTYQTALECMIKHSSEIEDLLESFDEGFTFNPATESFAGFACKLVSKAVELWVLQFDNDLDSVDWD